MIGAVSTNDRIMIQEVGMRDGLQSAGSLIETEDKLRLLNKLSTLGFDKIEVTSFVSPKAVPLLADAEAVLAGMTRDPAVTYSALVPNLRGMERALKTDIDEVNVVMSVSEAHNLANLRMSCEASIAQFRDIRSSAGHLRVNGTLATAFGCPFTGPVDPNRVLDWGKRYLDVGIDSLTLADTIGAATPHQIDQLVSIFKSAFPDLELTLHLHNTRGLGIANALAGIAAGVRRFDGSFGGIGGCPYAPGATGNVCTEDLVHALQFDGYSCNVDLAGLISVTHDLELLLPGELPGLVRCSGTKVQTHQMSAQLQQMLLDVQRG